MSRITRNITANFMGNAWVTIMSLAFVPVYVKYLGIEAYGLIGFFISIQSALTLLDLGLGAATTRELARMSVHGHMAADMRHLVRTLEWIYWLVAVGIACAVLLAAPWLATGWLQAKELNRAQVTLAVQIMGLAFGARWPFMLYSSALTGLERYVALNRIKVAAETLRSGGAALIVWLVAPSLNDFLAWQAGTSLIASIASGAAVWKSLPPATEPARAQRNQLARIWKFSAGVGGIAVTAVILTQIDKIVLSKLLTLREFGYYTLASTVANGLRQIVGPIITVFYPMLSQAVSAGDGASLRQIYHRGSQIMSVALLPVGMVLVLFSAELLLVWTGDSTVAQNSALILSILALGTIFNGLMNVPYFLQLAYGWTTLALYANLTALTVLVPSTVFAANRFGPVGAATIWPILNAGYILINIQVMHRRLLPSEKWAWYLIDVGRPAAICLAIGVAIRLALPTDAHMHRGTALGVLAAAYILGLLGAAGSTPSFRSMVRRAAGRQG